MGIKKKSTNGRAENLQKYVLRMQGMQGLRRDEMALESELNVNTHWRGEGSTTVTGYRDISSAGHLRPDELNALAFEVDFLRAAGLAYPPEP